MLATSGDPPPPPCVRWMASRDAGGVDQFRSTIMELEARSRPEISPCGAPFGHEPETAIDHGALGGREGIRCAVGRLCDAP